MHITCSKSPIWQRAVAIALVYLVTTASLGLANAFKQPRRLRDQYRAYPAPVLAEQAKVRPRAAVPEVVVLPAAVVEAHYGADSIDRNLVARRRAQSLAKQNSSTGSAADALGAQPEGGAAQSALLAYLFQDYDKTAVPNPADGSPVVVDLNIALHKIQAINLQEGTMDLNVWVRLHWKDPRLAWNESRWGVHKLYVLNQELRYMDIWCPDVTLWNSPFDVATTLGAQSPILRSTGDVNWGRNGMIRVACNFKGLRAFPFGPVKCLMEWGTWSHGPLSVVLAEAPQGGATIAGNSLTDMRGAKAVEWKFGTVTSWVHHYPAYPCCPDESNWPVVLVDVTLLRTQTLFALKIVVPQVVLALVSFMTFWLSPECGERLGVAVTIPLALAVYDLLVYSTLPASDDISCIGAIGLLGFLFSIVTLVINGAVIQLYHYREPRWMMGSGTIWAIWLRFRQQRVWGALLEVLDKLETELIKQHLKESKAAKRERQAAGPRARRRSFMYDWVSFKGQQQQPHPEDDDAKPLAPSRAAEHASFVMPEDVAAMRRASLTGPSRGRRMSRINISLLPPASSIPVERFTSPARLPSITGPSRIPLHLQAQRISPSNGAAPAAASAFATAATAAALASSNSLQRSPTQEAADAERAGGLESGRMQRRVSRANAPGPVSSLKQLGIAALATTTLAASAAASRNSGNRPHRMPRASFAGPDTDEGASPSPPGDTGDEATAAAAAGQAGAGSLRRKSGRLRWAGEEASDPGTQPPASHTRPLPHAESHPAPGEGRSSSRQLRSALSSASATTRRMQSRVSFSGVAHRAEEEGDQEDRRQDRDRWELEGAERVAGGKAGGARQWPAAHEGSPQVEPGGLSLSRRPGESGPVLSAAATVPSRPGVVELAPAIDLEFDINDFDFETGVRLSDLRASHAGQATAVSPSPPASTSPQPLSPASSLPRPVTAAAAPGSPPTSLQPPSITATITPTARGGAPASPQGRQPGSGGGTGPAAPVGQAAGSQPHVFERFSSGLSSSTSGAGTGARALQSVRSAHVQANSSDAQGRSPQRAASAAGGALQYTSGPAGRPVPARPPSAALSAFVPTTSPVSSDAGSHRLLAGGTAVPLLPQHGVHTGAGSWHPAVAAGQGSGGRSPAAISSEIASGLLPPPPAVMVQEHQRHQPQERQQQLLHQQQSSATQSYLREVAPQTAAAAAYMHAPSSSVSDLGGSMQRASTFSGGAASNAGGGSGPEGLKAFGSARRGSAASPAPAGFGSRLVGLPITSGSRVVIGGSFGGGAENSSQVQSSSAGLLKSNSGLQAGGDSHIEWAIRMSDMEDEDRSASSAAAAQSALAAPGAAPAVVAAALTSSGHEGGGAVSDSVLPSVGHAAQPVVGGDSRDSSLHLSGSRRDEATCAQNGTQRQESAVQAASATNYHTGDTYGVDNLASKPPATTVAAAGDAERYGAGEQLLEEQQPHTQQQRRPPAPAGGRARARRSGYMPGSGAGGFDPTMPPPPAAPRPPAPAPFPLPPPPPPTWLNGKPPEHLPDAAIFRALPPPPPHPFPPPPPGAPLPPPPAPPPLPLQPSGSGSARWDVDGTAAAAAIPASDSDAPRSPALADRLMASNPLVSGPSTDAPPRSSSGRIPASLSMPAPPAPLLHPQGSQQHAAMLQPQTSRNGRVTFASSESPRALSPSRTSASATRVSPAGAPGPASSGAVASGIGMASQVAAVVATRGITARGGPASASSRLRWAAAAQPPPGTEDNAAANVAPAPRGIRVVTGGEGQLPGFQSDDLTSPEDPSPLLQPSAGGSRLAEPQPVARQLQPAGHRGLEVSVSALRASGNGGEGEGEESGNEAAAVRPYAPTARACYPRTGEADAYNAAAAADVGATAVSHPPERSSDKSDARSSGGRGTGASRAAARRGRRDSLERLGVGGINSFTGMRVSVQEVDEETARFVQAVEQARAAAASQDGGGGRGPSGSGRGAATAAATAPSAYPERGSDPLAHQPTGWGEAPVSADRDGGGAAHGNGGTGGAHDMSGDGRAADGTEYGDDGGEAEPEPELTLDAVLHVETPELLEMYLQMILVNPSPELLAIRERVANAVNVFGMEDLVLRLFPIVGRPEAAPVGYGAGDGGGGGGGGAASRRASFVYGGGNSFRQSAYGGPGAMSGTSRRRRGIVRGAGRRAHHQVGAKAEFHTKIGDEYNAKWRLLSSFIDAVSRYSMPLCYAISFLIIMWQKVWANNELSEGPSPEASAAGIQ